MKFKLVMAGILLLSVISLISAVPQLPHQLYGSVSVNGQAAPDGMIISALCDGDTYQTTTSGGKFGYAPNTLFVEDPYGGRAGEDIEVYVNNAKVEELTFVNAGLNELNIELSELPEYCGDGICSSGESCSSCSNDCGSCDTGGNDGGNTGGSSGSSSSSSSSSSSTTKTCVENWQCTDWSDLTGACGTRTCTDAERCGTTKLKPTEKRECKEETETSVIRTTTGQDTGFLSGITGAVIGTLTTGKGIIALAFIIGIIGIAITVSIRRRKKRLNNPL